MANTNAPYGFMPIGRQDGAAWAPNQNSYKIANAYSTAIYKGDPILMLATGYVARGAAGNTAGTIGGIFMGCRFYSTAMKSTIWSAYWPGSGATGDIDAFIADDPNLLFSVQSSGTAIAFADNGLNADFALGTGSTVTGFSGASLDQATLATTATLPFRVVSQAQGVGNGTDSASSYNRVIVAWNSMFRKQTTGL